VTLRRCWLWAACLLLVVGLSRQIAYGLSDAPLAERLSTQGGGASLTAVAAISLGIAALASTVGLWLVATGLRERSRLELDGWVDGGRSISLRGVAQSAALLSVASAAAFTSLESWLHYQAGLGFHAYHCLFGPVHENALPILIALSLVVSAAIAAVDAVLAAARRLVAQLVRSRHAVPARSARSQPSPCREPRMRVRAGGSRTRGPPLPA
jgi:hypothetical protein